nr:hypothetical protein [Tanacetum cinerariifolium]
SSRHFILHENHDQAFVEYASLHTDKAREEIIEPDAIKDNNHNTIADIKEKVEGKLINFETVLEEGRSRDIKLGNLGDRACGKTKELEGSGEWMEYKEPLDLVDTRDESVYESLIEKMLSCSLSFNFGVEKGDPSYLKFPCMIGRNMGHTMDFTILENIEANIYPSLSQVVFGRPFIDITKLISDKEQGLITFTNRIKEVTFKTLYKDSEVDDLTSEEHDLLSSRVVLSEDDYRRGCERVSDLENGVNLDVDKLDPSYKDETYRINLDGAFEVGKSRKGESRDLEPLSLDIEILEIINLASSLDYLVILCLLTIFYLWTNMLILCDFLKAR